MTNDPHQLENLYYRSPKALTDALQKRLVTQWVCAHDTCP